MSNFYYNPELKEFTTLQQFRLKTGTILNKDQLESMGYYPYFDHVVDPELAEQAGWQKGAVTVFNGVAVQIWDVSNEHLEIMGGLKKMMKGRKFAMEENGTLKLVPIEP